MKSIFRILNKIFVLREKSRYYPKLGKVTLDKSGLILLGIGIVIFLMGLSVQDKQLTIENGNAIIGAIHSSLVDARSQGMREGRVLRLAVLAVI